MRPPRASVLTSGAQGRWKVLVYPMGPDSDPIDVTVFRGARTRVGNLTTTDPGGPAAASVTFPMISLLESPGHGDLDWLTPEADIDVLWVDGEGDDERVIATWEGFMGPWEWGTGDVGSSLTVPSLGAIKQLDFNLAKPEYLAQPLPYEYAIYRQFLRRPDLRVAAPKVADMFPEWWSKRYDRSRYSKTQPWLVPLAVRNGDLWTAMLTRETGRWDPAFSNYIASLLANMHTARGQFTLTVEPGRQARMYHRDHRSAPKADTLVWDLLWPGVRPNLTEDWTTRANVIYASGTAANGDVYTGMQVTATGGASYYVPAAFRREVHPPEEQNPWWDRQVMRKELHLEYPEGLDAEDAAVASKEHMQRVLNPGMVGTLEVKVDPVFYGSGNRFARQAVRAGRDLWLRGVHGHGRLFHITETSLAEDGTLTLTIDSQFRDHLTVDQVRRRGRDALKPSRMLSTSGLYNPKIPDLLFPWSYSQGAGVIPHAAYPLFTKRGPAKLADRTDVANPFAVPFPWTEYTKAFPPRTHPSYYIKIPPADHADANKNWANRRWATTGFEAHKVLLSAAGEIKLVQVAAYDKDGNVKKVPFHVSLYVASGISYTAMPMIPVGTTRVVTDKATLKTTAGSSTVRVILPKGHGIVVGESFVVTSSTNDALEGTWTATTVGATFADYNLGRAAASSGSYPAKVIDPEGKGVPYDYDAGQHYPFFPNAWEKILPDGRTPTNVTQVTAAATILAGWGTGYEKAGYWPGTSSEGDRPTGMLVDESGFSYSFINAAGGVAATDTPAENQKTPSLVTARVMIYCDEDTAASTFFLGRLFRKEPGA